MNMSGWRSVHAPRVCACLDSVDCLGRLHGHFGIQVLRVYIHKA